MRHYFLSIFIFLTCLFGCNNRNIPTPTPIFKNIVVLGNSITFSSPYPSIGWNGNWGMAASSQEKDYVHILERRFLDKDPKATLTFRNISDFEYGFWNYDLSKLNNLADSKPDLLIVRIGENVQIPDMNRHDLKKAYIQLIEYFQTKSPNVRILCVSTFWDQPQDAIILQAANDKKLLSVQLKSLSSDISNTAIGTFSDPGVASHPSDKGMLNIANMIWNKVQELK